MSIRDGQDAPVDADAEQFLRHTLQRSEEARMRLEAIIAAIGDGISIQDTYFRVLYQNQVHRNLFGDHIGEYCYQAYHHKDSICEGCPAAAALLDGSIHTMERSIMAMGRAVSLEVTASPFRDSTGAIIASIEAVRDITERKQVEREKEMRLIMSERLASLGQMAASIAHEINNPLAAILGCAEALQIRVTKERYDPVLFNKYLKIIQDEVLRCKNITTSMLSISKKATYEKRHLNVSDTLQKTLDLLGHQGRLAKVQVVRRFSPSLPLLYGSEGELRQVFLSVIANALDAMDDKGTLTVETREGGDALLVAIGDTGSGISEEHRNRIFDPFFTTKSDRGGTGLGLSIARKILANLGGEITVTSEQEKGTLCTIRLPQER